MKGPIYLVLRIDGVNWAFLTPISSLLTLNTVSCKMTGVSTDTANDIGHVALFFGAVVLAVTNLAT
jgi:hypothetical protein